MKRATRPVVGLGLVLACVVGTMALGTAAKSPCAAGSWGDLRQYRWLCYSDVVPLLGTEQLTGPRLPFLDDCQSAPGQNCDEYPVLTMYFMRASAWISGPSYAKFYFVNAALLMLCAAAVAICCYLMVGARALYVALAPTLLVYGTMNWDLLAVALATAAMLAFFRRRDGAAGTWLGLGAAAKLYPALLALPLIAERLRRRQPDRAIGIAWATAAAWAVVNLPFLLASPTSWFRFFRFNAERLPDFDSLWYIGCRHFEPVCLSTRTVNLASAGLFVGALALVWWLRRRRFPSFPRWTLGFPLIALFLLTNKVYSPQYGLWLLPWFAIALPGLRRFVAFEVADVAVFVTRFSWFGRLEGGPTTGAPQGLFEAMVVVRAVVLVWCVASWARRSHEPIPIEEHGIVLSRPASGPEPEPLHA